jgi:hypothetical protein
MPLRGIILFFKNFGEHAADAALSMGQMQIEGMLQLACVQA